MPLPPPPPSFAVRVWAANKFRLPGRRSLLPIGSKNVWILNFMATSQMFVFYAIIEYVLCNFLMRIEARVEKARAAVLKRREDGPASGRSSTQPDEAKPVGVHVEVAARWRFWKAEVRVHGAPADSSLRDEVAQAASGVTRWIPQLVSQEGVLQLRDQHVEIFSRWAFPLAYGLALIIFYASK